MPLSDFFPEMKGWQPAQNKEEQKPGVVSTPVGPSQNQVGEVPSSPYLRTSLPLPLQYTPDTLKQSNRPGLSSFRIAPLPPGGIPAVNAASSSVVRTTVIETVNTSAAGPNGAVQFNQGGILGGVSQLTWNNGTSTLTGSTINSIAGFQVGGAAALGQYLRGNGTDFVSSVLSGSDVLTGIVGVTYGGTGSNLSATGGASEVLLQTTVGGAVTVRQLTYADISGSLTSVPIWNTLIKTTTYTAVAGDMVLANTTGGGFTVTLPLSSANKNLSIRVKKTSSDTNTVTVGISGGDVIDGQSTQTFNSQYTDLEVTADGLGNWWIA